MRAAGLSRLAHPHVAHERKTLDVRHERAQMIRQMLGQHRQHAVRKVHGGRARAGFRIEARAHAHVVAHVGDGNHQPPPPAAQPFGIHRIVEVPGVLPIDGHERQIAQILAALPVLGQHIGREYVRLMQHFRRKFLR
jgi:hypothetical protein